MESSFIATPPLSFHLKREKRLPALLPKPETASSSATKVYHFHQWKAELNMELRLEVMEFQMFEVKPPACLRTESTPPTSRDSATRATDSSSASSINCAAALFFLSLGTILSTIIRRIGRLII
jgi:hypothetical protein